MSKVVGITIEFDETENILTGRTTTISLRNNEEFESDMSHIKDQFETAGEIQSYEEFRKRIDEAIDFIST